MTKKAIELTNTRYRLGYHVSAPSGWINDPNGFCYFDGYYHVGNDHGAGRELKRVYPIIE
ncbi:hypothetical protein [Enterococcus faecium]|uniref:hypothetical protein n=1 Tax=Enterococcus faecium TaxID=1352 RepID=UPI003BB09CF2